MKRIVTAFGVFLMLTLMTPMVWAQATAQINGFVKDQTGAVLPAVQPSPGLLNCPRKNILRRRKEARSGGREHPAHRDPARY